MIKIYNVIVNILDCNGNVDNSATFTFTNYKDRDDFIEALDHYQDLDEVSFEYSEDEYYPNTLEGAKKEVEEFLGLDEDNIPDDTDKRICANWPNGD